VVLSPGQRPGSAKPKSLNKFEARRQEEAFKSLQNGKTIMSPSGAAASSPVVEAGASESKTETDPAAIARREQRLRSRLLS
jgi:hypothetical protein